MIERRQMIANINSREQPTARAAPSSAAAAAAATAPAAGTPSTGEQESGSKWKVKIQRVEQELARFWTAFWAN